MIALVAATLTGCGPSANDPLAPVADKATVAGETMTPWPFNVPEVLLSCVSGSREIFATTAEGQRYAINGAPEARGPIMREVGGWAELQPLVARGQRLCDVGGGSVRLSAPSKGVAPTPEQEAHFRVEPNGDGLFAIAEANRSLGGARPTFTIACKPEAAPSVFFNLLREPSTPPPLRGVFGEFVAGDQTMRLEMSWGLEGKWTLRSDDKRSEDAKLVEAALASGRLTLTGASSYMPSRPVTWDLLGFGDEFYRIRNACAS